MSPLPSGPSRSTLTIPGVDRSFPGIDPKKITIGVELEMIIPNLLARWRSLDMAEGLGNPFELISRALEPLANDLGTRCCFPWESGLGGCEKTLFGMFQVKSDCTIGPYNPEEDIVVEVATPILGGRDWDWVIPRLCEAIKNVAESAGTKVRFNATTGLHVHIGLADRHFTLPELKRISKAIVLFERHMTHFHHECRDQGSRNCKIRITPCRDSSPLKDLSDEDALTLIDEGQTIDDIICKINGVSILKRLSPNAVSRNFRYNFTTLRSYGTIEFRQAMGTTNMERILDWINTIIKFITAAVKTPEHLFIDWAKNGIPSVVYYVYGVPRPPGYKRWKRPVWSTVGH